MATAVFPDVTPPSLESFDLNLETGIIELSFSETVNPTTVNITDISLQNVRDARVTPPTVFRITSSSSYIRTVLSEIQVNLSLSDLNAIKSFYDLASELSNTFLTVLPSAVEDRSDNPLVPILPEAALPVTVFQGDRIRPRLVSFQVDLDSYNFTLSFTETVNITTLDLTQITFVDAPAPFTGNNFTLSGGILRDDSAPSDVLVIDFLKEDRDEIVRLPLLCTDSSNCFLSHTVDLVSDASGNTVEEIELTSALSPLLYTTDTSPTFVTEFVQFDLNMGILRILFEEVINSLSVDPTSLRLQDFLRVTERAVMLTGGDVLTENGNLVTIRILNDDLNAIKSLTPQLCTGAGDNNCHLRLLSTFARDTFGNPIRPAVDTGSLDESLNQLSLLLTPPLLH